MNEMVAPDGAPARFDGQAWVSQDGKYWWNGAAWQRIGARRGPNLFVIGVGLLIVAAVALVVTGVIRPAPQPTPPPVVMGVTNAKIDSSTQIEFDYARPSLCGALSFDIDFFDKSGGNVGQYTTSSVTNVRAGETRHYRFSTNQPIPATAVRFVATAKCST